MPNNSLLEQYSDERAALVQRALARTAAIVVGRKRALSGIRWREDLIVTAAEAIGGAERVDVRLEGNELSAEVIAIDLATDVAVLRLESTDATPRAASTSRASIGSTSIGSASAGWASAGRASTDSASTGSASAGRASTGPASTGSASAGWASTGPASTDSAAAGPASTDPASTDSASAGWASTDSASTGSASAGPASTDPASIGSASAGWASTGPASTDPASAGPASTGTASTGSAYAASASGRGGTTGAPTLRVGEPIVLVGRTLRGPAALWGSVQLAGPAWSSRRGGRIDQRLELDLAFEPSFEGGAVIDMGGNLVGMAVPGPYHRTLGIPTTTIEAVLAKVDQFGRLPKPYIGVRLQPLWLDDDTRSKLGRKSRGIAAVGGVDPGSPAEQAHIELGDLLLTVDGEPAESVNGLAHRIASANLGQTMEFEVLRGGKPLTIKVQVGERPRH